MFNVSIEAPSLRAVLVAGLSCASSDSTRPHLSGVALCQRGPVVTVEATDGHLGWQATLERASIQGQANVARMLARRDVETAIRALASYRNPPQPKAKRNQPAPARIPAQEVLLDVDHEEVRLVMPHGSLVFKVASFDFPPLPRVFPERVAPTRQDGARVVGFNPMLLATASRAVEAVQAESVVVAFTWPEHNLAAVRVDSVGAMLPGVIEASGVVMPARV